MNHVAFMIPTLDQLAGAERQVVSLAKGFAGHGWRVTVVALSGGGGDTARDLTSAGVGFMTLGMRKGLVDPRGWVRFHRWLRYNGPDVVHAHLPHAAWMARWSRLVAPIPVLIDTIHTSATGTLGRRLGYRWSRRLPDRVSVVSQGVAEAYRSRRMISRDQLILMPNGVDVCHWRPDPSTRIDMRRRLGLTKDFVWLAAGRLDPVKDYPALLWAMIEVPKAAHLMIAGAGPAEGELRRLSIQFGLESRVRFLGFEPDVLPSMQAADAFVLSSRWEGLPMSLLEAGACALPAVATDVAGSREVVVHGKTGLLAAAGDSLALRQAMTRMMRLGQEERAEMGNLARRCIVEHFGLDAVLDRWETLYRELLATHPCPARWASGQMRS
jgi:glycosyltransferase involved in cell wall biosynthesis